jgi:inorganic triphosphatase YgiF
MVEQDPSLSPTGREVELKLRLEKAAVPRLRKAVAALAMVEAPRRRTLRSTYFDTPDCALFAAGWRLRVRQQGRHHVQTLKSEAGGLAGRVELESAVSGPMPEPERFEAAATALPDALSAGPLEPLFTTEIRRTAWLVRHGGTLVEIALDTGQVRAGERTEDLCELELELKQGSADALYSLALVLLETVPFRLEARAKSDRGFALRDGAAADAVRALPPPVSAGMPATAAFRAIAESCLLHAVANQEGALAGVAEGVHQLRVALRRLRSAFGLFRTVLPAGADAMAAEVKWLAGELGPARDFDVFTGAVLAPLGERPGAALDDFARVVETCRVDAHARLRAALRSPRATRLFLQLGQWLVTPWPDRADDPPVTAFADAALAKRAKKLRKAARNLEQLSVPELHRVRILGKRLRYAVEFFRDLYRAKPVRRHLAALARLQDVLGVLNDSEVGTALLREAEARAGRRAKQAWFTQSRALVDGWYAAQAHHQMAHLGEAWEAVEACKRFWSRPAETAG